MALPFKLRRKRRKKIKGAPAPQNYDYEHTAELSPTLDSVAGADSLLQRARQNTFTTGILAGLLGTAVMHILSAIWKFSGILELTTLQVSGAIFLNPGQINTAAGLIVGILAHIMVGSAGGILLAYFIKVAGKDFFWLKGLGLASFMLFFGMGFVVRIMNIVPQMRDDSILTLLHIINYFAYGLVVSYVIYKWGLFNRPGKSHD